MRPENLLGPLLAIAFAIALAMTLCPVVIAGQVQAQGPPPAASEGVQLIETFKQVASALHLDVWWLTLVTFSFVWGLRNFLRFVKVDLKSTPRLFGIFQLEEGWWPALRDWMWRGIAVVFACAVSAIAKCLAPESLPEVHWIVLGPTYGIGAIILYHIVSRIGFFKKLEGSAPQ